MLPSTEAADVLKTDIENSSTFKDTLNAQLATADVNIVVQELQIITTSSKSTGASDSSSNALDGWQLIVIVFGSCLFVVAVAGLVAWRLVLRKQHGANQGKEDIPDGVAMHIPHQATHIDMKEDPPLNPGGQLDPAQSEIQITVNALATNGPDKVDTGATQDEIRKYSIAMI